MKKNFMMDVAFTVEGPWESPEDITAEDLLCGMARRLSDLLLSNANNTEDVTEAFGFCDSHEVEDSTTPENDR